MGTPYTELTPDLIDRVRNLSPDDKDRLFELAFDEPPEAVADWPAELKRRLESTVAGDTRLLTRDEAEAIVRAKIRELGAELP